MSRRSYPRICTWKPGGRRVRSDSKSPILVPGARRTNAAPRRGVCGSARKARRARSRRGAAPFPSALPEVWLHVVLGIENGLDILGSEAAAPDFLGDHVDAAFLDQWNGRLCSPASQMRKHF